MVRQTFTFAGKSSLEFGCFVSGSGRYTSTAREYETYSVAGRNGDLHTDSKRYSNVSVKYPVGIVDDFEDNYSDLKNWLLTNTGYCRLEDSYDDTVFRLATFSGNMDPEMSGRAKRGEFDVEFDCKPQVFLKSGESAVEFTAAGSVTNPELTEALPLIRVYGAGTVQIGSYSFTVEEHTSDYMDIDCDIQDAFCGSTNLNSYLTISDFPVLGPGDNGITLGAGITKIEITPRWWRL